ncbi:MAG: hypothetical protein JKY31_08710 [Rhodobacteraceae bacterium]|nr:hypothetical protein [Paracoccaceae bacterium]
MLAQILTRRANRIANFVALPVSIIYVIFGGAPVSYYYFGSVEILAMLAVFYLAWKW